MVLPVFDISSHSLEEHSFCKLMSRQESNDSLLLTLIEISNIAFFHDADHCQTPHCAHKGAVVDLEGVPGFPWNPLLAGPSTNRY